MSSGAVPENEDSQPIHPRRPEDCGPRYGGRRDDAGRLRSLRRSRARALANSREKHDLYPTLVVRRVALVGSAVAAAPRVPEDPRGGGQSTARSSSCDVEASRDRSLPHCHPGATLRSSTLSVPDDPRGPSRVSPLGLATAEIPSGHRSGYLVPSGCRENPYWWFKGGVLRQSPAPNEHRGTLTGGSRPRKQHIVSTMSGVFDGAEVVINEMFAHELPERTNIRLHVQQTLSKATESWGCPGAVTGVLVTCGAVTGVLVTCGAVTGVLVTCGAVTGVLVTCGAVTGVLVTCGAVTGVLVTCGAVPGVLVTCGTVTGVLVTCGAVTGVLVTSKCCCGRGASLSLTTMTKTRQHVRDNVPYTTGFKVHIL
ncbi:hypothetical protein GWK47_055219 [Chionoecetes opilio]|uniref:Uncharacterized protein n=1 Tax=Chionoecetes opilio TaxID=41210 RepID=A0A8J4Y904_CHIOP|nr:hypothetical protein GWK47_055219 [Chionoecetes opilio]